jgi:hypothetical protein
MPSIGRSLFSRRNSSRMCAPQPGSAGSPSRLTRVAQTSACVLPAGVRRYGVERHHGRGCADHQPEEARWKEATDPQEPEVGSELDLRVCDDFGYLSANPAPRVNLPPEEVKEDVELPTPDDVVRLIEELKEPYSTMVYLVSVSSIRPEELAFKWSDLNSGLCNLTIVRAMNKGKFHTPKYQKGKRIVRLTEADVDRLLSLKRKVNAKDDDWMFPNREGRSKVEARTDLARAHPRPAYPAGRGQARAAAHHLAPSEALGSDAAGRWRYAPQSSPTASGALPFLNDGELLCPCSRSSGGRRGRDDQRSSPARDSGRVFR